MTGVNDKLEYNEPPLEADVSSTSDSLTSVALQAANTNISAQLISSTHESWNAASHRRTKSLPLYLNSLSEPLILPPQQQQHQSQLIPHNNKKQSATKLEKSNSQLTLCSLLDEFDANYLSDHSTDSQPRRRLLRRRTAPALVATSQTLKTAQRKKIEPRRTILELRRFFLILGIFIGTLTTVIFIGPSQISESLSSNLMTPTLEMLTYAFGDFDFTTFPNVSDYSVFTDYLKSTPPPLTLDEFIPGAKLAERGLSAKHPVILVPGIVSTGLEVWSTSTGGAACGGKYFRKRMWGTLNQFRAILLDKECWMAHIRLDLETGLDPPGIKLRAAQGLDAADYLFPGYWVWARIINNLAALGYDSNNMHLASYDWRLSFTNLEKRDQYFSKLKLMIELSVTNDNKAVIMSHSMGSLVFHYFLQWVQVNGGSEWPDKYLHRWVNIAGPMLGVPKCHSAMLSGEMRDTAQLNSFATFVLEQFLSKKERANVFRSWGGLSSMFVKGGNKFWGTPGKLSVDYDVHPNWYSNYSSNSAAANFSTLFSINSRQYSAETISEFINTQVSAHTVKTWTSEWDNSVATSIKQIQESINHPKTWSNPLIAPLPKFNSSFKVVCVYGVGIRTERNYYYHGHEGEYINEEDEERERLRKLKMKQQGYAINLGVHNMEEDIENGVQMTDGDATVPLLSLGYMCSKGWKMKRYNPSGVEILTREYKNRYGDAIVPSLRGGPESADHVDIMGNVHVLEDILRIAAGEDGEMKDKIVSQIQRVVERVDMDKEFKE